LASLSHLFTIASKEWRLTDRNPVRDIAKKKESRGRVRFLTDEERTRLIDACAGSQESFAFLDCGAGPKKRPMTTALHADT
jgi:hypothetical protein